MKRLKHLVIVLIFITAAPLGAHRVKLTNGRSVYGTIIAQDRKAVRIRVRGRVRVIPKSRIVEIDYSAKTPRRRRRVRPRPVRRITPPPPRPKPARVVREPNLINKWTIAGRSALLPGWGHHSIGDQPTSLLYGGSFAAAFFYAGKLRSSVRSAQSGYEMNTLLSFVALEQRREALAGASQSNEETLLLNVLVGAENFRPYNDQLNKYNQAVQILGLVYIGQLVHAYLDGSAMHGSSPGRMDDQSSGATGGKATTELNILPDFGNTPVGGETAPPGFAVRLGLRWRF